MVIRRRVMVDGQVQGVFFRDSCRSEARRLGVSGWVSNRADGRVEAVFEGESAAVQQMVDWAHHGPPSAEVRGVDTSAEEPTGESAFRVR